MSFFTLGIVWATTMVLALVVLFFRLGRETKVTIRH